MRKKRKKEKIDGEFFSPSASSGVSFRRSGKWKAPLWNFKCRKEKRRGGKLIKCKLISARQLSENRIEAKRQCHFLSMLEMHANANIKKFTGVSTAKKEGT